MKRIETETVQHPKTLLVGIHSPYNQTNNIKSYYDEFINLVKSNGLAYDETLFIKIRSVDPAYFLTTGKLEELTEFCQKHEFDEVIFSEALSPQQEKNLRYTLRAKVFDRTQLILEIFEKNAHTAEGKIQVELAMLKHKKSRLAGRGLHMSQQAGRIGVRGPGETAKEKETQHIERLMLRLKRELKQLEQTRETQRKRRLETGIKQICIIGYTNAGKSTILNALTHSDVLVEDKLFATLDTTTRELFINNKKIGLISDTVGFIQQLPHHLIEAFKSTLAELQYAHLLLHVIDISDNNWQYNIQVVNEVLKELEVDKPILYVFNKADLLPDVKPIEFNIAQYQPNVLVSSKNKDGLQPLINYLAYYQINK